MKNPDTSPVSRWGEFGSFLLRRAFWILAAYTLLFVITVSPAGGQPRSRLAMLPAAITLGLGAATWIFTLGYCLQAFWRPGKRPSILTSAAFFLIFGAELFAVGGALLLNSRPH
jgi:hypothetical protein